MHPLGLLKRSAELLLEHVVIASNHLFGKELLSIFGLAPLLQVRAMLSQRVRALSARTLGLTPDVKADYSADICLSSSIGCHIG